MRTTDIRVRDVYFECEDFRYRTPIKFGGVALDRVTLLNVRLTVEGGAGKTATGFGAMPLGNVWAYPSRVLTYDQTLGAMRFLASRVADAYRLCGLSGHPIDITHRLEPELLLAGNDFTAIHRLSDPVPKLAVLVVASAFDAALHDAYGKLHGLNCFRTYTREFLPDDLSHYLGAEFDGLHLDDFITHEPKPSMPLYHLVGALDPITPEDVTRPVGDGLPEHLAEWITRDGLTHLKIKLNGDDLGWDVERCVRINAVAEGAQRARGVTTWWYSLDFNERCQNVGYLIEFLQKLRERTPAGYDRVQYVEQPTARDLKAHPENKMHAAAKLKPVVIDESLLDLESLKLSMEMGYTGVAFKACKGQTQTLLLAAAAQKYGLFRCVQDLTCVGASLIHSASLAAHIPGVAAIESNGRQYCPAANAAWDAKFPGVFAITGGSMNTALLNGVGLGAVS
ncbi:mandelate racemase/muconate lactonizing enzyme family protein [Gemmata sp. JC717]|uniref:mandelate racemase/muconate lactonizing enzyme family protein n=1 Tax=Gemmata algarum TaxID=2975278 RepID=UPI0021BB7A74|nr:mandelate racemase/muconate lactonizing enzyme family protein [Gemmata algarum]MDY3553219.1 mandelate racemase/muconate lactonizing enzyme family protein [Gemmata algarum]